MLLAVGGHCQASMVVVVTVIIIIIIVVVVVIGVIVVVLPAQWRNQSPYAKLILLTHI